MTQIHKHIHTQKLESNIGLSECEYESGCTLNGT